MRPVSRFNRTVALAAACLVVGAVASPWARLDAAKAAGQLDVTFGPLVVEGRSAARVYLSLRNFGAAASKLALGDTMDVTYGSGATPTSLAFTGSQLTAAGLPTAIAQQPILGAANAQVGLRLAVQGEFSIEPGTTTLIPFDFVAGDPGIAPVVVDLRLGKAAGKFQRRIDARVAKTPPRSDVFYGDGAAGALTITQNGAMPALASWTDVTIAAGVTVNVPSGTTIRCTGTFNNLGTIVVGPGGAGGGSSIDAPGGTFDPVKQLAGPFKETGLGDALATPGRPSVMVAQASSGASGGVGLGSSVFRLPLSHYRTGGGGGSGTLGAIGGSGGGILRVLARGEILNPGTITAAGSASPVTRAGTLSAGGGGGGGGVVILASATHVESTGTVDVQGGAGGPPDALGSAGGGGGGGLVIFAAPQVGNLGTTNLLPGAAVIPAGVLTPAINPNQTWCGGGGGGACAGNGGGGYGISATGVLNGVVDGMGQPVPPPANADIGQVVTFEADPRTIW